MFLVCWLVVILSKQKQQFTHKPQQTEAPFLQSVNTCVVNLVPRSCLHAQVAYGLYTRRRPVPA